MSYLIRGHRTTIIKHHILKHHIPELPNFTISYPSLPVSLLRFSLLRLLVICVIVICIIIIISSSSSIVIIMFDCYYQLGRGPAASPSSREAPPAKRRICIYIYIYIYLFIYLFMYLFIHIICIYIYIYTQKPP